MRDKGLCQQEFNRLIKNSTLFGKYYKASQSLTEGEVPVAWFEARHPTEVFVAVLVTDRRVLLFRDQGFSVTLLDQLELDEGINVITTTVSERYADLVFCDPKNPQHRIEVRKVPIEIGEKVAQHVRLPLNERRQQASLATPSASKCLSSGKENHPEAPVTSRGSHVGHDLSILKGRTRRAAEENRGGEKVRFVLLGLGGQALVALESKLLIIKPGFLAGAFGGVRVTSFSYADITAIEINTGLLFGVIEIGTPSYILSESRDFWTTHPDKDPWQANNCLPVDKTLLKEFIPYIEELRRLVHNARTARLIGPAAPEIAPQSQDLATQLQKLAELRDKGLLTDEEYTRAKAKLLNQGSP